MRVGIGYDVHAFAPGRKLILGGVEIDHPMGLSGHSDADVLVHAIMDALLGAAGLGDIGCHFPDRDERFRNIRSLNLLEEVYGMLASRQFSIINIDAVIICESPKISPFAEDMKRNISDALAGLDVSRIGIKGTTTEKLGFTGRSEGIAAQAVALLSLNI